ncbi:MAG: ketoacyl-ACP synthase III [Eubacterium sp.]|nr:ketoacyl-ACP synthase III [Eubacterium sp.]
MFGKIIGLGSYIPEKRVTNEELSEWIDSDDCWIRERTGIHSRHVMEQENTAEMATKAAKAAVKNAGIAAEEIDLIMVSSVSSNLILPNTACFVQEQLHADNAMCFDINTACTGFMVAYNTVQAYIHLGVIKTALIVAAEGLSKLVDWEDRGTCILFGDGAGAAVIQAQEGAVFETVMHADGSGKDALFMENDFAGRGTPFGEGHETKNYIAMDGREVFRFAVSQVPKCIQELLEHMGKAVDDIDCFVLHQANERIVKSIAKRLKIPVEKVPMNMAEYGNTSSACIPILLTELVEEGRIKKGDRMIMSGFGAGLTWAATYLEF